MHLFVKYFLCVRPHILFTAVFRGRYFAFLGSGSFEMQLIITCPRPTAGKGWI